MPTEHAPFLAHLRKTSDPDTAFAAATAVKELTDSAGWALVNELLDQTYEEAVTRLLFGHAGLSGGVLEQAEYARLIGFLAGLRQCRWAAEAFALHAERVRRQED